MSLSPLLRRQGSAFLPAASAAAPWAPNMLHGRVVTALAGHVVERRYGLDGFRCARLTVDLFRAATLDPVQVTTRPARQGGRLRVIDVEIASGGTVVARATALLLRGATQPAVEPWQAPAWDVPAPGELSREDTPESRFLPVDTRAITVGGYRAPGRKRLWMRELCVLVEGEPWTPLTRAAAVADLTNAIANTDTQPNHFINADVTMYVGRPPKSEWIGLDVTGHLSAEGIAVGSCDLYDTSGRCGAVTMAALAARAPLSLPVETVHEARATAAGPAAAIPGQRDE